MGDGQPDAKKRKISDLRASIPFCSQSALAAICKEIDKGGLPEKHSRHSIWQESNNFLEDPSMSMYGPLFQTAEGTTVDNTKKQVLYLNFLSLLAGAFRKGGAFTDFCSTCMRRCHHLSPNLGDVWHTLMRCTQGTC